MGPRAFALLCCAHVGAAMRQGAGEEFVRLGESAGECSAETRNACGLDRAAGVCGNKDNTLHGECRNGDCGNCAHGYCRDGGTCRPVRDDECRLAHGKGGDECKPRGKEFCLGTGAADGFEFVGQGRRGAVFKATVAPGGARTTSLGTELEPGTLLAVKMAKAFTKDQRVDPVAETEAEWSRLRALHKKSGPAGFNPCVMEAVDMLHDCTGGCCTPYLVVDWREGPTLEAPASERGDLTGAEALHLIFAMYETARWLTDHGVYDHDKAPMNFISPQKGAGAFCITWIDMGPVSSSVHANLRSRTAAPLGQAPKEFREWVRAREGDTQLGTKWLKEYATPKVGLPCRVKKSDVMVQDCAPDLGRFYHHIRKLYREAREEGLIQPGTGGSHLSFEGELADRLETALAKWDSGATFRKLWYDHLKTNFPAAP